MNVAEDLAPTGTLRASINLDDPVLAQGTGAAPTGVTVDIAREIAARLDVPVELVCFDAARKAEAAFTAPYALRAEGLEAAAENRRPETVRFLRDLVEELKASGFVAGALRRSNQPHATVAPPA